jgi:hypothetical protein
VVEQIVRLDPKRWQGPEPANTLRELNGTKLEIRTDPAHHAEIATLLTALRRLAEISVVLSSELYEVDRDFAARRVEPALGDGKRVGAGVTDDLAKQSREAGSRLQTNRVTVLNGREAAVFSRRTAIAYSPPPAAAAAPASATAFEGFGLRARVAVSADRRSVWLDLSLRVTELIDMSREGVTVPGSGVQRAVDVPNLLDRTVSGRVPAGDGQTVVIPVRYPAAKGKQLLLLVQPVIRIEEEERAKAKGR